MMEGFYLDLDPYCRNCENFVPEAKLGSHLPEGIVVDESKCDRRALCDLRVHAMMITCAKREQCRMTAEQIKKNQPQQNVND